MITGDIRWEIIVGWGNTVVIVEWGGLFMMGLVLSLSILG